MKVKLYAEIDFEVDINHVANVMNSLSHHVKFESGGNSLDINSKRISNPSTYLKLSNDIHKESGIYLAVLIFTNKVYDNNFFFETESNICIISCSNWKILTDISKSNGVVFFITSILTDMMSIGQTHNESIGCINDFWFDKTKIDVGMRSAYLCNACKQYFIQKKPSKLEEKVLLDITSLLDLVSDYSRKGKNVLEYDTTAKAKIESDLFDVFICHNGADKPMIRTICSNLKAAGLKVWLDEEQIRPGKLWQVVLEENIKNIKSVAVFVGQNNIGPWQDMEIRAFLSEFVNRSCPTIPVILENCTTIPELPIFLRQMMWVDMRKNEPNPISQIKWGITGLR